MLTHPFAFLRGTEKRALLRPKYVLPKNVDQLQSMLQELSISGRETFASTITLLTTKICIVESEDEFSYIRTVLKVFVLYFIITSDFA